MNSSMMAGGSEVMNMSSDMTMPTGQPKSMSTYFNRIDTLTSQTDTEPDYSQEITRKHWKPAESTVRCFNKSSCGKQFSLLERHHHCRRCGNIFCASCLQYKRKLNRLAHLDPQGQLYKVCKTCYEEGQSYDGCTTTITALFVQLREQHRQSLSGTKNGGKPRRGGGWRNRLNIELECQRLVKGFRQSVGKSEVLRTLHEMRSMLLTPEWQKSSLWLQESNAGMCQVCCQNFGLLKKRNFCKVCSVAICKDCSTNDLLVYIPDKGKNNSNSDNNSAEPQLAIIKIVGCPEVEPEISMYLTICSECRGELIKRQVEQVFEDEVPAGVDMLAEIASLHGKFSVAEENVNKQLKNYQEIVESLEDNRRRYNPSSLSGTKGSSPQSNMQILAKAQEDLSDFLAQHVMVVQHLKKLVPKTDAQSRLLKNYIKAKCDFYLENMSTFRKMKNKLSESSPPEVLEFIQRTMDKNAIISAHLYLRQLVYEALHLCEKYELQEDVPQILVSIDQVVEKEVAACLQRDGEDIGQHLELLKEMIRTQMKEHTLIRPSRAALMKHGKTHVQILLGIRVRDIVEQVTLQLKFKSANRSFPVTKQALNQISQQLLAA